MIGNEKLVVEVNCTHNYFPFRYNAKGNNNLWLITLKFSKIEFICSMIIGVSTTLLTMCILSLSVLLFPNEFHLPINFYIVWLPFHKFSFSWAFNYVFQVASYTGVSCFFITYWCVSSTLMNHTCWIIEAAKLRLTNLNSYLEEEENFDNDDDNDDGSTEETRVKYFDTACDAAELLVGVVVDKQHGESPDSLSAIIDDLLRDEIFHEPTTSTWQEGDFSRYTKDQDGSSTSGYQRPQQSNLNSNDSIDSEDSIDTIYLAPNTDPSTRQPMRVKNTKRQSLLAAATDKEFKELMKEVAIMMCELIEWKNKLKRVLRFSFMVELSIISMVFAICIFALSSDSSNLIITACFICLGGFSEFFYSCLIGSRVSSHIDDLAAEIYNVKWYLMTPKQRMDILILLPVTQKMKTFDGIFKEINTTTFQQVKLSAKSTKNVVNVIFLSGFKFCVFIVRSSERSLNEYQPKTRTVLLNVKHF